MRDQGDAEPARCDIDQGETDAVNGDGAFADHLTGQFGRARKPEHLPLALPVTFFHPAQAINVSLNNVAAQSVADFQGALQVDVLTGLKRAQVGQAQRLRPDLKAKRFRGVIDDRQAHAIDGDAFPADQFRSEACFGDFQEPAGAIPFFVLWS